MKSLRQRLRKLCVSPAEELSECMQMPAVANAGNCDGSSLPPVDADVVAAFAEQLQLSIDQPRTLKLLSGLGDGGDRTTVSVSEFLNALQGPSRGDAQPGTGGLSPRGPGDTIKLGSGALTGAHAAAAAREERKRELMQQSKPKEHLGCAVCRQYAGVSNILCEVFMM